MLRRTLSCHKQVVELLRSELIDVDLYKIEGVHEINAVMSRIHLFHKSDYDSPCLATSFLSDLPIHENSSKFRSGGCVHHPSLQKQTASFLKIPSSSTP